MSKKLLYYRMYIGKGTVPATSYVEIKLKPRNPSAASTIDNNGNAISWEYDLLNSEKAFKNSLALPVIYFFKKRRKGFDFEWVFEDDFPGEAYEIHDLYGHYITMEYEAETSGRTGPEEKENLFNFASEFSDRYDELQDPDGRKWLGFDLPYTLEFIVHSETWQGNYDPLPTAPNAENGENIFVFNNWTAIYDSEPASAEEPEVIELPVTDPVEGSTLYSPYQQGACFKPEQNESFGDPQYIEGRRVCPTCIPNPSFQPPSWLDIDTPWLDESTCNINYKLVVKQPKSKFNSGELNKESYVRRGIVEILAHYNKVISEQDICASPPGSAPSEDSSIGESLTCGPRLSQVIIDSYKQVYDVPSGQNDGTTFTVYNMSNQIINEGVTNLSALELYAEAKDVIAAPDASTIPYVANMNAKTFIRIIVPANLINLIPQDILAEESEAIQEFAEDIEQVIIKGSTIRRTFKTILPKTFKTFGEYQALYWHVQGGKVKIDKFFETPIGESPVLRPIYFSSFKNKFKEFYEDIFDLLEDNGYKLYADELSFKSNFKLQSKYSGDASIGIGSAQGKYKETDEIKFTFSKENSNKPFAIKSIEAKYVGCPWKKLKIGFQAFKNKYNEKQVVMNYVAESNNMMSDIDNNQGKVPPWMDFVTKYTRPALTFIEADPGENLTESCLDSNELLLNELILEADMSFSKALEYALNSLNCRKYLDYDKGKYMELVGTGAGGYPKYKWNPLAQSDMDELKQPFNRAVSGYKEAYDQIFGNDTAAKKFFKKLASKKQTDMSFFEKIVGVSAKEATKKLGKKHSRREFIGEILTKINPCNWEAITLSIVSCLLKGLNPVESLQAAAKSLLNAQSPDSWERIFTGLTFDQQIEIKAEVEKYLPGGSSALPFPWDFKKEQMKKGLSPNNYESQRDPPENPSDQEQVPEDVLLSMSEEYQETKIGLNQLRQQLLEYENSASTTRQEWARILGYESEKTIYVDAQDPQTIAEVNEAAEEYAINWLTETDQYLGNNEDTIFYDLKSQGANFNSAFVDQYKTNVETKINEISQEIVSFKNQIDGLTTIKDRQTKKLIDDIEDGKFRNDVNAYEKAVQQILTILIESYTEALIKVLPIESLKRVVNSIPGSEVLGLFVATSLCANQSKFDSYLDEFLGGVELNPCMGKYGWELPEFPELPGFEFMQVLKFIVVQFMEAIVERIFAALTKYLLKVLKKLASRVCDVLSGIGLAIAKPDDHDLLDAIAIAFCGSDSFINNQNARNDANNTLTEIITSYAGVENALTDEDILDWMENVSNSISAKQFLKVFAEGPEGNQDIINAIWEATEGSTFEATGVLSSEEDVNALIANMSNYLSLEQIETLLDLLEKLPDVLDEQTLAQYCKYTCIENPNTYEFEAGVTTDGDGIFNDVRDLYDSYLNGPDEDINDILSDISFDPGSDEFCEDAVENIRESLMNGTVRGKKGFRSSYSKEMKDFSKALSKSVFGSLDSAYIEDMIGKRNSVFNGILADSDNALLNTTFGHDYRVRRRILFANAAHTIESHRDKFDNTTLISAVRAAMWLNHVAQSIGSGDGWRGFLDAMADAVSGDGYPKATYIYPHSVGLWMLKQIIHNKLDISYKTRLYLSKTRDRIFSSKEWKSLGFTSTNIISFEPKVIKPDLILKFNNYNKGEDSNWKMKLAYSNTYIEDNNNIGTVFYGNYEQFYSIQLQEFITTTPPWWDLVSLIKNLSAGSAALIPKESSEIILDLKVPVQLENNLEMYELYKPDYEATADVNLNSNMLKSNQELAFINYLKSNVVIQKLMQSGYVDDEVFLQEIPFNLISAQYFDFKSDPNTLFGKIKDLFAKNIVSGILAGGKVDLTDIVFSQKTSYNTGLNFIPKEKIPDGFLFGYKNESEITYFDLLYVNPEAKPDDQTTWSYTYREEDKVLGKSATENPRVVFLDPEIYGGTYRRPKVYVNPHPYKGWLGIMQMLVPEDDGCDPRRDNWLFLDDLGEHVSKLENNLTRDKRLTYDLNCIKKPPFDLIADVSTHAYLDGIVVATIRTYINEFLIRTVPVIGNLKYSSLNYDDGMGLFFMNLMKEEMRDFPKNNSGGTISRNTYWYLFLEQMVQTVERRIISGDIIKDEYLAERFEIIKQVKEQYVYPSENLYKLFKRIKNVSWNIFGEVDNMVLEQGGQQVRLDASEYSNLKYIIEAVSLNAFGENFKEYLKGQEDLKFKPKKNSLKDVRLYTKVYDIYRNEVTATEIASRLLLNELDFYRSKMQKYLPSKPNIDNLSKYILNPKCGITIGPDIEVGTTIGESVNVTSVQYGDVFDVVENYKTDNIMNKMTAYLDNNNLAKAKVNGFLYLEKYVILRPKPQNIQNNTIWNWFQGQFSFPIAGRPIPVEKFKLLWDDMLAIYPTVKNYNISDFFGDLFLNGEELQGSLGIQFGVRLSYMPPAGYKLFNDGVQLQAINIPEADLAKNPSYYVDKPSNVAYAGQGITNSINFRTPVPLVDYCEDIKDRKFDVVVGRTIDADLKCYIDKMCDTKEYKFLMEYVFNIKAFSNLASIYSFYAFPNSIGEDPTERAKNTRLRPKDGWIDKIMSKTKNRAYLLFKKFYMFENVLNKEEASDPNHKKQFKNFNMPRLNINLGLSVTWWQRRLFYERPFNENGQECLEGAIGSFNQYDSRELQPFANSNSGNFLGPQSDQEPGLLVEDKLQNIDLDLFNTIEENLGAAAGIAEDTKFFNDVVLSAYNDINASTIDSIQLQTGIDMKNLSADTKLRIDSFQNTIMDNATTIFKPTNEFNNIKDTLAKADYGANTIAQKFDLVDNIMTNAVNEAQSANNMPTNTVTSIDYLNNKEGIVASLSEASEVSSFNADEPFTAVAETEELTKQELETTNTLSSLVQNTRSIILK